MKKLFFFLCTFLIFTNAISQTKKDIELELKLTKSKLDSFQTLYFQQQSQYQQKIVYLESIIDKVRFVLGNTTTQNNSSSSFSSQNILNNNIDSSNKQKPQIILGEGDGLTPRTGAKIYTGPNGGQYYINKNGNKTYIKKNK
jgi:colicin import membrane protein